MKETLLKTDARIKIIVLAGTLAMVLTSRGYFFPALVFVFSAGCCLMMRMPLRVFALRFSEPLFIAGMLVALKGLSGKTVIFGFGPAHVLFYSEGLREGCKLALRVMAAVGVSSAVSRATPFQEFLSGLRWFRVPGQLTEVGLFAARYMKMFFEEAQTIYNSQKNRLGYAGLRRSMNSFGILAGSLAIRAFDQAKNTSTAMLQRGYDGKLPAGLKKGLPRPVEVLAGLLVLLALGAVWKIQ